MIRTFKVVRRHPWRASMAVRWAYGLRLTLPIACGAARVPLLIYVLGSAISCATWATVFTLVGWAFGRTTLIVLGHVRRYENFLVVLIVVVLAIVFWIMRKRHVEDEVVRVAVPLLAVLGHHRLDDLAGPLAAALLSLAMGLICIRLSKLYFGMLQISLGSLVWAVVYRWYSFTGGDDGIHGIPLPDAIGSPKGSYYFTLIVTALCVFAMHRIVRSPFGKVIQGIRDNPVRAASIGVDVRRHQLASLVIAGFFGGVAGSLFVVVESSVFPDMMFWTFSLEVLIMCLLGGMYTFFGPLVGASAIVLLRVFASVHTQYWSLILGTILTLVIIFLPDGVLGVFVRRSVPKEDSGA